MGIRNIVENRVPWFVKRIDEYLMEGSVKKPAIGRFRPSDFVDSPDELCFRELQYNYMGFGIDTEFDLGTIKRMMAGTAHHNMWEEVFREALPDTQPGQLMEISGDNVVAIRYDKNKPIITPIRVDKGANYPCIRMMCDWTISKDTNGDRELVEWKTGRWSKPAKKHIIQWSIYALALGIDKGWIAIENREDADPTYYPIQRDDTMLDILFTELRKVENFAKKNEILPKDNRCLNGVWKPHQCAQHVLCFSEKGDCPWS